MSPSDSSGAYFSQGQTPRSFLSAIYIPSSRGLIDFGLTTWHVALGTTSSGSCGFFRATDILGAEGLEDQSTVAVSSTVRIRPFQRGLKQ